MGDKSTGAMNVAPTVGGGIAYEWWCYVWKMIVWGDKNNHASTET